jgi:DNA-binding response OmpR family regulator
MMTARGEAADRVVDLAISADDDVVKPFESPELIAAVFNNMINPLLNSTAFGPYGNKA